MRVKTLLLFALALGGLMASWPYPVVVEGAEPTTQHISAWAPDIEQRTCALEVVLRHNAINDPEQLLNQGRLQPLPLEAVNTERVLACVSAEPVNGMRGEQ